MDNIIWDSKKEAAAAVGRYRVEKFYSDQREAFWEQKGHFKTVEAAIENARANSRIQGGHWRVRDAGA